MRRILHLTILAVGFLVVAATPSEAGGGCHGDRTQGAGTTVELASMCFSPTALHVEPGTEVTFVNRDSLAHVVIGVGWGEWKELGIGDSVAQRFDEPGAFPYTCNLHPGMSGVVLVGDTGSSLTTEPIAATRDASSGASPILFGLAIVAVVVAVFAGRLTAKR